MTGNVAYLQSNLMIYAWHPSLLTLASKKYIMLIYKNHERSCKQMKKRNKYIVIFVPIIIVLLVGVIFGEGIVNRAIGKKVPILMYHCITEDEDLANSNSLYVTKKKFEEDLKYLKDNDYTTIFAKDMDKPLPKKPVVITFDDGYKDNYIYGYPLLKEYDMKATIFILAYTFDEEMSHKLSWEEAGALARSGFMDIQSHTYDLHYETDDGLFAMEPFPDESDEEYRERLYEDIEIMNERFDKYIGYRPTVFAYPYGKYTKITEEVLKEEGYKATFTTEKRIGNSRQGLYLYPRMAVYQKLGLDTILKK